nr:phospholipid phosphatase 3-like [Penaeus vannamei]
MCVLEWFRVRREPVGKKVVMCGVKSIPGSGSLLRSWTIPLCCATSQLTTDIAKYSVGRLRPHFIAICKPDWSKINCSEPYVDPIPCTSDDAHRMKEARLSFPSGHASFSAFYHDIFCVQKPQVVRPFLQFVCLMMTFYTTISRISDYKHHWSDVLFWLFRGSCCCSTCLRICVGSIL